MSWHVLGAGSLGCLWAARLALADVPSELILRNQQRLDCYMQQGAVLRLRDLAGVERVIAVPASMSAAQTPITNLLVACKAQDALTAVLSVRHRLQPDSRILLLQNGLGSQQQVVAALPQQDVLLASTTEGAYMAEDFYCVHAGRGQTLIGSLSQQLPVALPQLQQAGIDWCWDADILAVLWRKLALNCMINPLTVLNDCLNGELRNEQQLLAQLAAELCQLPQLASQLSAEQLLDLALLVVENTAANSSSMRQDVRAGRRTEIAFISGYVLEQARKIGVKLPQLEQIHCKLQRHLASLGLPTD